MFQLNLDNFSPALIKDLKTSFWEPILRPVAIGTTQELNSYASKKGFLAEIFPKIRCIELGSNQAKAAFEFTGNSLALLKNMKYLYFEFHWNRKGFKTLNTVLSALGQVPDTLEIFKFNIWPANGIEFGPNYSNNESSGDDYDDDESFTMDHRFSNSSIFLQNPSELIINPSGFSPRQ